MMPRWSKVSFKIKNLDGEIWVYANVMLSIIILQHFWGGSRAFWGGAVQCTPAQTLWRCYIKLLAISNSNELLAIAVIHTLITFLIYCNQARITGKLNEWVMIGLLLKRIDAKSPSLKLMATSAQPRSSLLTLAATNS